VLAQAVAPNLVAEALTLVNRVGLPDPGGIGTAVARGRDSRGKLPDSVTAHTDRAAARNNERPAADAPPPLPAAHTGERR